MYSEQAEATEFPVPGTGSRGPPKKTPREGRPNQALRCSLSAVCLSVLGGGEGPDSSELRGEQRRASLRSLSQEHQPAPPHPGGLQPLCSRHQGI